MRLNWTDDEAFEGQFELWQANCKRSLRGKRGQATLREMEAALLALPVKELAGGALETPGGAVCAIGALARHKSIDVRAERERLNELDPEYDDSELQEIMEGIGHACGMPSLVAWKAIEINDIECGHLTPEKRYERVLRWVRSQIVREEVAA